ncbi:MAG: HlyD family efflux transporter periplasmic adaptor subunit [Holosporaceae bacterium]|jgi:HlyD family secretion protein|nr:HlyD family efflux transporter periplasmic adaptor subunit [Holosporaceae bacterium]
MLQPPQEVLESPGRRWKLLVEIPVISVFVDFAHRLRRRFSLSAVGLLTVIAVFLLSRDSHNESRLRGYVEGEFVYIAPATGGILENVQVTRGQMVRVGDAFFTLETTGLTAALNSATARYNNLTKGKRPEEISVIEKQKEQVEANLISAKKSYDRCRELAKTHAVSQSDLDEKTAAYKALLARQQEISAAYEVAKMGARSDEIDAAGQEVIRARNDLDNARPVARQDGQVEDVYYHPGEFVTAGAPVVSFLPSENIKIRFFVAQRMLPKISVGKKATIILDESNPPVAARIVFISPKAEFTPPVIYSVGSSEKLMFLVEAIPEKFDKRLHPGLPVTLLLDEK